MCSEGHVATPDASLVCEPEVVQKNFSLEIYFRESIFNILKLQDCLKGIVLK